VQQGAPDLRILLNRKEINYLQRGIPKEVFMGNKNNNASKMLA
jgi:hypothetical protein